MRQYIATVEIDSGQLWKETSFSIDTMTGGNGLNKENVTYYNLKMFDHHIILPTKVTIDNNFFHNLIEDHIAKLLAT